MVHGSEKIILTFSKRVVMVNKRTRYALVKTGEATEHECRAVTLKAIALTSRADYELTNKTITPYQSLRCHAAYRAVKPRCKFAMRAETSRCFPKSGFNLCVGTGACPVIMKVSNTD